MRYPEFLKKNWTVSLCGTIFGCNIEPYKTAFGHALDKFEKWVTAQNWAQIAMKDAVSASAIRRKNADRS